MAPKQGNEYYPFEKFLSAVGKCGNTRNFPGVFYSSLKSNPSRLKEFSKLMKSNLNEENLIFLIEVLSFLSLHIERFREFHLIDLIICDEFFDSLVRLINFLYSPKSNQEENSDYFTTLVEFYGAIVFFFPESELVYQKIYALFQMTFDLMKFLNKSQLAVFKEMRELLKILEEMLFALEHKGSSYKDINYFPFRSVLFQENNLLPNVIDNRYENSQVYLDIQFKLLKEDFFENLRENFISLRHYRKKISLSNDFGVYTKVSSVALVSSKFSVCHKIRFSPWDREILEKCNWTVSKKFMNGSLLIFSNNNFRTYILGMVYANLCAITEGKVISLLVSVIGNPYLLKVNEDYDMMEPDTFFEPYHQSLRVFQTMNPLTFPMAEDIISINRSIELSPIAAKTDSLLSNVTGMNESQLGALRSALYQKFTLIQGPPGTGKSFTARKLISLLCEDTSDSRPVLFVSLRNRSLDIVLEPLAMSGLKVLRLGRTDSQYLDEFTLFNYKEKSWNLASMKRSKVFKVLDNVTRISSKTIRADKNTNKPESIEKAYNQYDKAMRALKLHIDYFDASQILFKKIQVIGATTTGAAKKHEMLSKINPKIVIVEEAAEILESFVTTSLPKSCEHLILIGDHLQLQPISSLPDKFNFQVSLFERMVLNGKSYNRLTVQHRMRPEIAELVRDLFYNDLTNHPSVEKFPNVMGMSTNVFFFSHKESEEFEYGLKSFRNNWEGDIILSFANYLTKQGYGCDKISILCAYSAQLSYIIKTSEKYPRLQGMTFQTIDNYQGDENDIIILSLVRSNGKSIGFLRKPNRVNVALSRAKNGLYMFGNLATLSKFSQIWPKVNQLLSKKKCTGEKLPLRCRTHKLITLVSSPQQIDKLELGGCSLVCGKKMSSGRKCLSLCHPNENHSSFSETRV